MLDITLKAAIDYEVTQPCKVELTRSQRGNYGWTITIHAAVPQEALDDLERADTSLRKRYILSTPEAHGD